MDTERDKRKAEFDKLFSEIPAKSNAERCRIIARILCVKPITVRFWTLSTRQRVITEASLTILKRELARQPVTA